MEKDQEEEEKEEEEEEETMGEAGVGRGVDWMER